MAELRLAGELGEDEDFFAGLVEVLEEVGGDAAGAARDGDGAAGDEPIGRDGMGDIGGEAGELCGVEVGTLRCAVAAGLGGGAAPLGGGALRWLPCSACQMRERRS